MHDVKPDCAPNAEPHAEDSGVDIRAKLRLRRIRSLNIRIAWVIDARQIKPILRIFRPTDRHVQVSNETI